MTEQDVTERIKAELAALHSEEVTLNNDYRYKYHSGMRMIVIQQDLNRIKQRRVELEVTLRTLEEFKRV